MIYLEPNVPFPEIPQTAMEGVVALGGELSVNRLLEAYGKGVFPWFEEGQTILWWCPDPRFVLFPKKLKVSKSMKQVLRSNQFRVTYNQDFRAVIENCANIHRKGQDSTWITQDMIQAYVKLHQYGFAKSVEVWENNELVGGLYGVDLGKGVFCGESMFAKVSNASKVGFIRLVQDYDYRLIDCQVHTDHLASLGAEDMAREVFLSCL
ncbi:leucyl/phenylalanyl-tRNA--protein transferase [Mangrovimonas sp. CR14]|uniref:leucyl/phenylalanyl-tRNA--protein transferase n=1 Tax=Mangrovimonas sp. CR14 TaxID=2706120 RepID=UPI00142230CF|nr:leucyl/phenylalanyl-tRNA--protein transferase [Mangrovimonas sp. CR14]NIK91658.1 leucyl/phenylalanyl-tRNA--protein transferase [Mangrovimonas sp. CR14]